MMIRLDRLDDGSMQVVDLERQTHHILIEEVNDHVGKSSVAPVSMNQKEFF